jgi:hypothetical protein
MLLLLLLLLLLLCLLSQHTTHQDEVCVWVPEPGDRAVGVLLQPLEPHIIRQHKPAAGSSNTNSTHTFSM